MKRSGADAWTWETTLWIGVCAFIALSQLLSCTPVKAVEAGVRVDTDNCREADAANMRSDRTLLDCVSGGEVKVRVELARSAWEAAKASDAGAAYANSAVQLAIDGAHCKADAKDDPKRDVALLDCRAGRASYVVTIGREEWRAIEARTTPAPYPTGPGK